MFIRFIEYVGHILYCFFFFFEYFVRVRSLYTSVFAGILIAANFVVSNSVTEKKMHVNHHQYDSNWIN